MVNVLNKITTKKDNITTTYKIGDLIEGYYDSSTSKFYEESTYTTEIEGAPGFIYVDLTGNYIYRYDAIKAEYIQISGEEINIDPTPTQSSTNAVQSGGVYTALDGKVDKVNNATNGHLAGLNIDGNLTDSGIDPTTLQPKTMSTPITVDGTEQTTVEGALGALNTKKINISEKGAASGIAELDTNGRVPSSQLPSYVDDVKEGYLNSADGKFYEESTYETEIIPEADKIYVDKAINITYRWSGSVFVPIGSDLALGETSSTAYRGDRGKIAYDTALANNDRLDAIDDIIPQTASASNKLTSKSYVDNQIATAITDAIGGSY